jgi:glyoxylase-like metal-dependent hydrolase (beta-lactamase superfamily II)
MFVDPRRARQRVALYGQGTGDPVMISLRAFPTLLAASLLFAACAPAAPPRTVPAAAEVILAHGDARVLTYVSKPWGFSTSSYFLQGPDGLVMIDAQFLPSAAVEAVEWAESLTGKKVVAAIVLHANPDKFNGTEALQKRGIRVLASDHVADLVPAIHEKRKRAFHGRYAPDYPAEAPTLERFGSTTTTLHLAGIDLVAHVLGPGCSESHVVVEWEGHVFVGDLVANDAHSWLEIGKTDEWLRRLDEIRSLEPTTVHPGRGPSGDAGLLDRETSYLQSVIDAVSAESPATTDETEGIARAKARLLARWPGLAYSVFLDIGLPAEWTRQERLQRGLPSASVSRSRASLSGRALPGRPSESVERRRDGRGAGAGGAAPGGSVSNSEATSGGT